MSTVIERMKKRVNERRYPKSKRWSLRYYVAVDEKGAPILRDAQVPIYWRRKVAEKDFAGWKGAKIKRCSILIQS